MNDTVDNRGYEALLFGNILGPSSDLYSFWDSSERFSPGLNLATYDNPAVDGLIETARLEIGDPAVRVGDHFLLRSKHNRMSGARLDAGRFLPNCDPVGTKRTFISGAIGL